MTAFLSFVIVILTLLAYPILVIADTRQTYNAESNTVVSNSTYLYNKARRNKKRPAATLRQ
jgi:hypothetical protein